MRYLRFLSLSFSILHEFDSSISRLHHLESIDFSHNNIHIISCDFQNLKSLKYLDISNNNVDEYLNQKSFESLPSSLSFLDLTGNPWTCSPSLSWLYTWSLKMSPTIQSQLNLVQCRVPNSHQMAPLLQAMEYYTTKINPFCPKRCFCTFYHFPSHLAVSPSYTVLVNCSRQGITTFPTLPKHTTILDLSHNKLSDSSFEYLKFEEQNYEDITGMILSHNQITTIHPMLTKMKLHRMFKADHNRLKEVPYDFSLLLQSFAKIKITLADNRWECRCNAEIVSLSLLARVLDSENITCSHTSNKGQFFGQKALEVDHFSLCPPSSEGRKKELLMEVICLLLAVLNMFVFSKLFYDYQQYKTTGKLPGIIYWIPFL